MIELINKGWDISIYHQKKRISGQFVTLIQWRAKKFGMLKEHTNDHDGFATAGQAEQDIIETLGGL
jgi:hypothetical protein